MNKVLNLSFGPAQAPIAFLNYFFRSTSIRLRLTSFSLICVAIMTTEAYGMEFGWGTNFKKPNENSENAKQVIWMIGEIKAGDYEKFRRFVLSDMDSYIASSKNVYLSSNGGNVIESLKLAMLLKAMFATVTINPDDKCASACFLLFVGGVERYASFKNTLGVHRAYFDPSFFAGLTPLNAEKKLDELTRLVSSFLEANSIPKSIIEKMTGTSSKEIHWLSREEINTIGRYPPWYEEMLIAKCNYLGETRERNLADRAWFDEVVRRTECQENFIVSELKRTLRTVLQLTDPTRKPETPSPTNKSN